VNFKDITGIVRAAFASALMFLAGAMIPIIGGPIMFFAPAPVLGNAVGFPYARSKMTVAILLGAGLVLVAGGLAAATLYLVAFGVAAAGMGLMLERRQPFELIVLATTALILVGATVAALAFTGSPDALMQSVRHQLAAGIIRGEGFYKTVGIDTAISPDTRDYIVATVVGFTPALVALSGALMVLVNLVVFWRWSGKQQRIGYSLFGDLARWSAPEWLIWPLLVSGFGWFIPQTQVATVALNCFICIVAVYFGQGLAIMAFYFKRLKMPAVARGLIYFVTLAQPMLTAAVGIAGVFDLWVDFRRLKQPDMTARNLGNFL
jgi:uncharacterized protein YybS (DUF2232 family)